MGNRLWRGLRLSLSLEHWCWGDSWYEAGRVGTGCGWVVRGEEEDAVPRRERNFGEVVEVMRDHPIGVRDGKHG